MRRVLYTLWIETGVFYITALFSCDLATCRFKCLTEQENIWLLYLILLHLQNLLLLFLLLDFSCVTVSLCPLHQLPPRNNEIRLHCNITFHPSVVSHCVIRWLVSPRFTASLHRLTTKGRWKKNGGRPKITSLHLYKMRRLLFFYCLLCLHLPTDLITGSWIFFKYIFIEQGEGTGEHSKEVKKLRGNTY